MSTSARSLLQAVSLGESPSMNGSHLEETAPGAVVSGCIVAFEREVSAQHRKDVIQTLLFAQIAANVQAERSKAWTDWYRQYSAVIDQSGWMVQSSFSATPWQPPSKFWFAVPVLDVLKQRVGSDAALHVSGVLNIFRENVGGPAQQIFECPSHSGGLGNFQVGLALEDENGIVTLHLARVMFQAGTHVGQLSVETLPSTTKVYAGLTTLRLNEQIFSSVRATITSKLGDRYGAQVAYISPLPIPDLSEPLSPSREELENPFGDRWYDGRDLAGLSIIDEDPFRHGTGTFMPRSTDRLRVTLGRPMITAPPPPIIWETLINEPGNMWTVTQELTTDPDRLYISLEAAPGINWWKSITAYSVQIPAGQDQSFYVANKQFLVSRPRENDQQVRPAGFRNISAAFSKPNAVQIGRIEVKDNTDSATMQPLGTAEVNNKEIHLVFHKGGFLGFPWLLPVEFSIRGGLGKRYVFRVEAD